MKKDITALFVFVDDFCKVVDKQLLSGQSKHKPTRTCSLTCSEILTIILLYYQSPCKNFKYFYLSYLLLYKDDFGKYLSYNRFLEIQERSTLYLALLLDFLCSQSDKTGISYIDATSIAVCHPKRISRNKVFKGVAQMGKTTKGWFFGLKLHLVINEKGELQGLKFTPGNVDDREPVPSLTKTLTGLLFGDKGYIKAELFQQLYQRGLKLVTGIKSNMKNKLVLLTEKVLLRKRSIIETVFDQLKNMFELEHTRHRSVKNALIHFMAVLVSYSLKNKKPHIKFNFLIPN